MGPSFAPSLKKWPWRNESGTPSPVGRLPSVRSRMSNTQCRPVPRRVRRVARRSRYRRSRHRSPHGARRGTIRGDSRLRDWPDSEWRLVRENPDDPSSPRYFSAYGRGVDQPEQLLSYDEASRHLTIAGGSRKDGRTEGLVQAVIDYIAEHEGCAQVALEGGVPGRAEDICAAWDMTVERGLVTVRRVGNRKEHHLTSSTRPNSSGRADEVSRDLVPLVL